MVTNHDVATLADWWLGDDLQRRVEFGLVEDESAFVAERTRREEDKALLLSLLDKEKLLPATWARRDPGPALDLELSMAVHCLCARSRSPLVLMQLEELQLIRQPVNIPGTHLEYPNWRRKQEMNVDQVFALPGVADFLQAVHKERSGAAH